MKIFKGRRKKSRDWDILSFYINIFWLILSFFFLLAMRNWPWERPQCWSSLDSFPSSSSDNRVIASLCFGAMKKSETKGETRELIGNGAFPRPLAVGRRRLALNVAGYSTVFCCSLLCTLVGTPPLTRLGYRRESGRTHRHIWALVHFRSCHPSRVDSLV